MLLGQLPSLDSATSATVAKWYGTFLSFTMICRYNIITIDVCYHYTSPTNRVIGALWNLGTIDCSWDFFVLVYR